MKSRLFILFVSFTILLYLSCKKTDYKIPKNFQSGFINSAIGYLASQLDDKQLSQLDYNSIQVFQNNGKDEIFKIYTKDKLKDKFIILAKPNLKFSGNWVEYQIDKMISYSNNQGIIKTESFNGKVKSEYWFKDNEVIKMINSINGNTRTTLISDRTDHLKIAQSRGTVMSIDPGVQPSESDIQDTIKLPPVVVVSYPHTVPINFYSLYWPLNRSSSYFPSFTSIPFGYSSTPSVAVEAKNSVVNLPILQAPDRPVLIQSEIKCLGTASQPGTKYFARVNVNQPNPGSRSIVSLTNNFHAGHTYITLEQQNPDGSIIIRNVGFYPAEGVKPGNEISTAAFGDDSATPYTVALTVSISASELQTIKQSLINQAHYNYELQTYNCVNAAVNVFSSINVHLPQTYGQIQTAASMPPGPQSVTTLFKGLNAGDFGEDIRKLNANEFSLYNGQRQVIIEKYNDNDHYRNKSGTCP